MRIWFDVTKAAGQRHRSGLMRVSERLREALARRPDVALGSVVWSGWRRSWKRVDARGPVDLAPGDWVLTPELFCEDERPGLSRWLDEHGAQAAAIFHDAIPLRFPEITWPKSVSRHPGYMRMLARFGRVLAISQASAEELRDHWHGTGVDAVPAVATIPLGADGQGRPRSRGGSSRGVPKRAIVLGILEPRKNQGAVLDAVEILAREAIDVPVTFAGRVNPHFGPPIAARIAALARAGLPVEHLDAPADATVAELMAQARFAIVPSLAEGCGLPVLEALWAGLPVLAAGIPSIVESARGGGCLLVDPATGAALADAMRRLLGDDALVQRLQREAVDRDLPVWADTAAAVCRELSGAAGIPTDLSDDRSAGRR